MAKVKASQAPPHKPAGVLQSLLPRILHDMSQPLGALRCGIELARMKRHSNGDDADLRVWLEQTERLGELLDRARELAEIECSHAGLEACDLAGITRALLNDLRGQAEARNVALVLESPRAVHAQINDQRIYRALQAILLNALEHANAGHSLRIAIREVDDEARISISGISSGGAKWQVLSDPLAGSRHVTGFQNWPLLLAKCVVHAAGGLVQYGTASGGLGNLLIRLPLAHS